MFRCGMDYLRDDAAIMGESVKKSVENTCVVVDLSSVIRSQAGVSNAETFAKFATDIINTLQNILKGSERLPV